MRTRPATDLVLGCEVEIFVGKCRRESSAIVRSEILDDLLPWVIG